MEKRKRTYPDSKMYRMAFRFMKEMEEAGFLEWEAFRVPMILVDMLKDNREHMNYEELKVNFEAEFMVREDI